MIDDLLATRGGRMRPSALREMLSEGAPPRLSLGGGLPPPEAFPFEEVAEVVTELMAARDASALQYTSAEGDPRLRSHVASAVTTSLGRAVPADDVVVTTGTQQAIDLVARVLLDPEDVAVVESPTYVGALRTIAPTGARIVGVRSDEHGMITDRLEEMLADGLRPKLVYVVPNFSNPSGATLSLDRRRQLARLAERHRFVIVEDDQYGRLRFRGQHLPPVSAFTEWSVYVSGFSKIIAPGLRVGHLVAHRELVRPIVLAKQATDLAAPSLGQRVVTRLVERGDWLDSHVGRLCEIYRARADALVRSVRSEAGDRIALHEPDGGMFTWARLAPGHGTAADVVAAARVEGLAVVPGNEFSIDGGYDHDLRLSYSMHSPAELAEAAALLARAIAASSRPVDRPETRL